MFVYDMVFRFHEGSDDYDDTLTDFFRSLSGNNQIIIESLNISGKENVRIARVTTPFKDSLHEKYYDTYSKEAFDRLSVYLSEPVSVTCVGEDFTCGEDCSTATEAERYLLRIHLEFRDLSPICCFRNRRNIPYYLLPRCSEDTMRELTSWATNYAAYDQLFYATGIGEISAHKMLSGIGSRLNQKGLSVCRMLEGELGKPVYYYLYRFYGKQPAKCPLCGGEWKQQTGSTFDYQCDHCRIVADKTPDE